MFSRHFLRISDRICIPVLDSFGDNNPKAGRGLNAGPSACHPRNWDKICPVVPPRASLSPPSSTLTAVRAPGSILCPPRASRAAWWGLRGLFSPTQHRARTWGQPPPAPVPPAPSPQAPRERPVVIFTLRSSALLTTHVWLRPPPGDNIWARTSGGHSSRPPRAAAPASPGRGWVTSERLMWSHYHHRLPAQLLHR